MTFSRLCFSAILLSVVLVAPGCTKSMSLKMDAAWERVDPMGHRSEHQQRHYPRGNHSGLRLPENYLRENQPPLPGSR